MPCYTEKLSVRGFGIGSKMFAEGWTMLTYCVLSACLTISVACERQPRPHPRTLPTSQLSLEHVVKDELRTWGQCPDGVYAVSFNPHKFYAWKWKRSKRVQHAELDITTEKEHAWLGDEQYSVKQNDGAIHLRTFDGSSDLRKWALQWGWYLRWIGQSLTGKYVAFVLDEDSGVRPEGHDWDYHRVRIGMLGPDRATLEFDCIIREEPDAMNIRSAIPSNDGASVAVGGWNGGVAIADMHENKLLWSKRPPEEIVSYYVAFSKDSKTVFLAGASGYVFGLDTKTGKQISRWCATLSGKPEHGRQVTSLTVSRDGRYLAAGSGRLVFVFDIASGGVVDIVDHGLGTYVVAISPDSDMIATMSPEIIRTWIIKDVKARSLTTSQASDP